MTEKREIFRGRQPADRGASLDSTIISTTADSRPGTDTGVQSECLAHGHRASDAVASEIVADPIETALREFFRNQPAFVAVYLYGSHARGKARADSDVDLGLLYATPPAATLDAQPFELEAELSRLLDRHVECTVLNSARPDLIHRVLRDGKLIAETDKQRRIAFEVKARNEYFDILPTLLQYRKLKPA
jgi:predicted nucleotidyltransferase